MPARDHLHPDQWGPEDRQRFADHDILKSKKIPGKRKRPPDKSEWGY